MSERPRISHDERVRAIAWLLVPAFIGHTIQLLGEDVPWAGWARVRYWTTPGWHLDLSPWIVIGIAVALAIAVIGMAVRRTRPWMSAVIVLYAAHYLTYPYRIRNHMTLMLASLLAIGGCWAIGRLSRAVDRWGAGTGARLVDRHAMRTVAVVLCITYFFAGVHKTNLGFLSFDARSSAFQGVTDFWIYGDLGHRAPDWVVAIAIYGTLVVEHVFPIAARLFTPLRCWLVIGLMLFHFPHIAVMNVADYPMLASAFYPALFTRAHWRLLERRLRRPSRWNVSGAVLGVAAHFWFMPYWGALMVFGALVVAIWGWWAGSMLEMELKPFGGGRLARVGSRWRTLFGARGSGTPRSRETTPS